MGSLPHPSLMTTAQMHEHFTKVIGGMSDSYRQEFGRMWGVLEQQQKTIYAMNIFQLALKEMLVFKKVFSAEEFDQMIDKFAKEIAEKQAALQKERAESAKAEAEAAERAQAVKETSDGDVFPDDAKMFGGGE